MAYLTPRGAVKALLATNMGNPIAADVPMARLMSKFWCILKHLVCHKTHKYTKY